MKETKRLTEGALFSAIYILVLLITLYVPFVGMFLVWFLPLPFIIYVLRYGFRAGIFTWLVALFGSFLVGGIQILPLTLMFGSGGIVVGELYRREKSGFAVLLGGSLSYITNFILFFVGSIVILNVHPVHALQDMMRQSVESAEYMIHQMGQEPSEQLALYYEFIESIPDLVPMGIVLIGVLYALLIQLAAGFVLKRMRFNITKLPAFRTWRFPKSFLWYYLIVLILLLLGVEEGSTLHLGIINLFHLLGIIMTIQGLSFVFYFSYEKQITKALPIIVVILIFILPGIMDLIRILGIIDLGFDLRRRVKKE